MRAADGRVIPIELFVRPIVMAEGHRPISPDTPLRKAARRLLRDRLKAVGRRVGKARKHDQPSPEIIHEVRIATRRAGAAVRVFRNLIRGRDRKRVSRWLRELRQAAADTRRADVQTRLLAAAKLDDPSLAQAADEAIARLECGRAAALQVFHEAARRRSPRQWRRLRKRLTRRLRDPAQTDDAAPSTTFSRGAAAALSALAGELREITDAAPSADLQSLHRIRLDIKRLRYSIEIFRPVLADRAAETLDLLREVQTALGEINDLDELRKTLAAPDALTGATGESSVSAALSGLIAWVEARLAERREAFEASWSPARWAALCEAIIALPDDSRPATVSQPPSTHAVDAYPPPSANGHAHAAPCTSHDPDDAANAGDTPACDGGACVIETYHACPPPPRSADSSRHARSSGDTP